MFIHNISLATATVSINGINIMDDIMDSGSPFEMSDVDIANIEWSCNGRMIRTVKPAAVMISVSVIPGSPSDASLFALWKNGFNNGGVPSSPDSPLSGGIKCGSLSISLSNGTCISGPCGVSADGPDRLRGNTYTFAFELSV